MKKIILVALFLGLIPSTNKTIQTSSLLSQALSSTASSYLLNIGITALAAETGYRSHKLQQSIPKDLMVYISDLCIQMPVGLSCISGLSMLASLCTKSQSKYISWKSCAAVFGIAARVMHEYNKHIYLKSTINTNHFGYTPLIWAIANRAGHTPLIKAAQSDSSAEIAQILINAGANVNYANNFGNTPLIRAAQYNSNEIAQILITAGAQIDLVNQDGWTALMFAAESNSTEIAQMLITAGANVDLVNQTGYTALMETAYANSPEIARLLIAAGAQIDLVTQTGYTALMKAAQYNRPEIAQMLITAGANVNCADNFGYTPLIWAAKYNSPEIARLLIAAGADPTMQTRPTATYPDGRFAHELVPAGNTPEQIAQNQALQTTLETWYDCYTNPGLK